MKVLRHVILPALLALSAAPAFGQMDTPLAAQDAVPLAPAPPPEETPPEIIPPPSASITIPALTRVEVEIQAEIGSNTSKSGDRFPFRLAAPLMVDGREVIPVGAGGMGEVVHAKKSGAAGAAGELVLAARYLDIDGRRLKLRSLRLVPMGANLTQAAGGASFGISFFAFLIKGGQAIVPWGTIAEAKTAADFTLAAAPDTPPRPADPSPQKELPPGQPADAPQPTGNGEEMQ